MKHLAAVTVAYQPAAPAAAAATACHLASQLITFNYEFNCIAVDINLCRRHARDSLISQTRRIRNFRQLLIYPVFEGLVGGVCASIVLSL